MCGARILDGLRGEEDVRGGVVVEGAVLRCGGRVGSVSRVFEEKDEAVERLEGCEFGGVEGEEFFELDIFYAEVFDEGGEDALGY